MSESLLLGHRWAGGEGNMRTALRQSPGQRPPGRLMVMAGVLAIVLWGPGEPKAAEQPSGPSKSLPGRRWALLIGVDQYKRLVPLDYCGNDVRALGQRLTAAGFEPDRVVVLHNKADSLDFQPLKANIEEQIKLVLGSAKEGDLVLVAFSGHGIQLAGRSYLCPYEANLEDPATLVPLEGVFRALEDCPAAVKLFVVDACQNEEVQRGERTAAAARAASDFGKWLGEVPPPKGTLLVTSCAPGEKSWEAKEFQHGVFMHYLLEGLEGRADSNGNGMLTLSELFAYASDRTQTYVRKKHEALQRPRLRGDIVDFPLVENVRPKAFTNSIGMKLVLIPAGEFLMGSPESDRNADDDEKPQHRVRITRPFYLGAYEVTVGQFRKFVEDTGYKTDAEKDGQGGVGYNAEKNELEGRKPQYSWQNTGFAQGDEHPVVNVSWNDAVAFCEWLSRKEGKKYRLPTEAEWEYACRAGTTTRYYCGDDPEGLAEVGNVADAAAKAKFPGWRFTIEARDGYVFTAPVGRFRPNGFGVYDMHGNVWEWCADWYDGEYYGRSPVDDPPGPSSGAFRVFRGGGWLSGAAGVRAADRDHGGPGIRYYDLGFRVCREGE